MTSVLRSTLLALTAALRFRPRPRLRPWQTTKLKLVLNWKYQGPQRMFFIADDSGYFKPRGPRGHARPGQRLGRSRNTLVAERHLRCFLWRYQRAH